MNRFESLIDNVKLWLMNSYYLLIWLYLLFEKYKIIVLHYRRYRTVNFLKIRN